MNARAVAAAALMQPNTQGRDVNKLIRQLRAHITHLINVYNNWLAPSAVLSVDTVT
jgi:hypothetical protein